MVQIVLIGIAAGAASALLIAALASGSLLAMLLFHLAPLPLMIAALGWSQLAGLIAAFVSAAALVAVFGYLFVAGYLVGIALPAWWLSYLALLGRPSGTAAGSVEWFPVGRLVIWAALTGSVVGGMFVIAPDPAGFRALLKRVLDLILRIDNESGQAPADLPSSGDIDQMLDLLVIAIPPTAAALSTLTNLGNLWLAAQIARVSGRLARPWPMLSDMVFPRIAAIFLAVAAVGTLLPEVSSDVPPVIGRLAAVLAASLFMAYAMLGLAVLHATTRGIRGRGMVLAGTYATVAVLGWPVLVMTLIGLVDSAIDIRGRIASRRSPSAPRP
ncbi:MAG TPA: DUF2232 domain-containing protein [Xanthobacteraceae bacterium]|nr:DUF2232 domain-containing protein [Xanthobacteraceae bacterium]